MKFILTRVKILFFGFWKKNFKFFIEINCFL